MVNQSVVDHFWVSALFNWVLWFCSSMSRPCLSPIVWPLCLCRGSFGPYEVYRPRLVCCFLVFAQPNHVGWLCFPSDFHFWCLWDSLCRKLSFLQVLQWFWESFSLFRYGHLLSFNGRFACNCCRVYSTLRRWVWPWLEIFYPVFPFNCWQIVEVLAKIGRSPIYCILSFWRYCFILPEPSSFQAWAFPPLPFEPYSKSERECRADEALLSGFLPKPSLSFSLLIFYAINICFGALRFIWSWL